jgi:hypothetical protein
MSETTHSHHRHGGPNSDSIHHGYRPSAKRPHCDWRFYLPVSKMLVAMIKIITAAGIIAPWLKGHPTNRFPV